MRIGGSYTCNLKFFHEPSIHRWIFRIKIFDMKTTDTLRLWTRYSPDPIAQTASVEHIDRDKESFFSQKERKEIFWLLAQSLRLCILL